MKEELYIKSIINEALALVVAAKSMCKTAESWEEIATVLDIAHMRINAVKIHLVKNNTRISTLEGMTDDDLHG